MTTQRAAATTTTAERTVMGVLAVAALAAVVWVGLMVLTIGSWALSG
ncbi:morphogenic membrane protein MmpA [Streptomyces beijiangensis]|uniref:Uncharacterized protein n=1 Tax=Streptomyces beijiangensis TaxID=163361 RepID=A0A939JDH3_9ACTN|nr:hypothetical protein [Streptomyces beijiangensis]MBO0512026.1 hypothetical protein [Streptomyces beijiangensis]